MDNAYEPPRAELRPLVDIPKDTGRPLHSPGQLAVATLLGSICAAAWLARWNLIALGQRPRGNRLFGASVLVGSAMVAVMSVLPDDVPGAVYAAPQVVLVLHFARREFGQRMLHRERRSNWHVAAACVVSLVVIVGALVLWEVAEEALGGGEAE